MVGERPRKTTATDEVASYLALNAKYYLEALGQARTVLETMRTSSEGRRLIHSIYSRGERQPGGNEFKQAWQIKEKVNWNRSHGNPTFAIQDTNDIIGLTLLCAYEETLEEVVTLITESLRNTDLRVRGKPDDRRQDPDNPRAAIHLILYPTARHVQSIRLELQVKTLLQDAWDFWTHDLTYKPESYVGESDRSAVQDLKDDLLRTEERAARVARAIEADWDSRNDILSKLRLAYVGLWGDLVEGQLPQGDTKRLGRLKDIARRIRERPADYSEPTKQSGAALRTLRRFATQGCDKSLFLVFAMLSLARVTKDLDTEIIDVGERWQQLSRREEYYAASDLLGVFLFLAGKTSEAVDAAERSLEHLDRARDELDEAKLKGLRQQFSINLIHYLAEVGEDRRGARQERALRLIRELEQEFGDRLLAANRDTIGYGYIVFGSDVETVKSGQEMRARAKQEAMGQGDTNWSQALEIMDPLCDRISAARIVDLTRASRVRPDS